MYILKSKSNYCLFFNKIFILVFVTRWILFITNHLLLCVVSIGMLSVLVNVGIVILQKRKKSFNYLSKSNNIGWTIKIEFTFHPKTLFIGRKKYLTSNNKFTKPLQQQLRSNTNLSPYGCLWRLELKKYMRI